MTEDECFDMGGIAAPHNLVLLHFPAFLGAIDPMPTANSPLRGSEDRGRTPPLTTPVNETLKPHGILSGNGSRSSHEKQRPSLRVNIAPIMCSFTAQITDKMKRVVLAVQAARRQASMHLPLVPCHKTTAQEQENRVAEPCKYFPSMDYYISD